MQQQIVATVLDVEAFSTRRGTGYRVKASDGNAYTTFNPPTAEQAVALKGQNAVITFTVKQNGNFTNYNVDTIMPAPAGMAPTVGLPASGVGLPLPAAGAGSALPQPSSGGGGGNRGFSDADKLRVTRLAAVSTAFDYAGSTGQDEEYARTLARRLIRFAYTGDFDDADAEERQVAQQQPVAQVAVEQPVVQQDTQAPPAGDEIPWQ